ncbi:MAG: TldD/PmbA family protein [Acidimicrobiales bacterium]
MPELVDLAVAVAGQAGPDEELEAYVSRGRQTQVRAFEGEVESFSSAESAGVGVRVVHKGRTGFAWVGSLSEAAAAEALAEARDNGAYASEDPFAGLASPDGVLPAELDLWRDDLAAMPNDDKIELALDLERQARAGDPRIRQVVHADYGDAVGESAIATSTGISVTTRRSTCQLAVYVVAGEGGDDSQTGYGCSAGRQASDLDVAKATGEAVERATRLLGARKPPSARLTVVFDRRITAVLVSIIAGTLSGEEVAKGRSLFTGRTDEEVAVPAFTLVDDPTNAAALGAAVSDGEGLSCRRNRLIDGGKLLGYLYDTHAARAAGTVSTGSAVRGGYRTTPGVGARAVSLEPGDLGQQEILAKVGEGLLVQSVSGVHSGVNPVSGDFSVGAEGLMVRGGALAEPVREITIASSLQRMLQHVLYIGADVEWLPGLSAGLTLAIDDVSMSGA